MDRQVAVSVTASIAFPVTQVIKGFVHYNIKTPNAHPVEASPVCTGEQGGGGSCVVSPEKEREDREISAQLKPGTGILCAQPIPNVLFSKWLLLWGLRRYLSPVVFSVPLTWACQRLKFAPQYPPSPSYYIAIGSQLRGGHVTFGNKDNSYQVTLL